MMKVFSTARLYDTDMVREYVEAMELEGEPLGPPDGASNGAASIVVDRYLWGRVFYAEHQEDDVAATWIERNDVRPSLAPWLEDVRSLVDRPQCLGFHEDDHVCDGGINPETGVKERACRWRSVCLEVQRRVKDPAAVDRFLERHTDAELWELSEKPAQSKPKADRPRRLSAEDRQLLSEANLEASKVLVTKIFNRACEMGHWEVATARWRATQGQYFLVEWAGDSGIVMYRRRPLSLTGELRVDPGTEQSICMFDTARRDVAVTLRLNTSEYDMIRDAFPDLQVSTWQRDPRKTQVPMVSTAVIGITNEYVDQAAQIIVAVVEGGFLNSYGVGATDPERPGFGIGRWKNGKYFKDNTRYIEARTRFIEHLKANGWSPPK